MCDIWIRLHQWDKGRSEFRVPARQLNCKGWEDEAEIPPIWEISGAEEGRSKLAICEYPLRDSLGDSGLPCPGQPVHPVDGGPTKIARPKPDLVQNRSACPLQTTFAVTVTILGSLCSADTVEDGGFSCWRFVSGVCHREWKMFKPGFCRAVLFRSLGHKRGVTHYQLVPLVVSGHLLHHLMLLSIPRRVPGA